MTHKTQIMVANNFYISLQDDRKVALAEAIIKSKASANIPGTDEKIRIINVKNIENLTKTGTYTITFSTEAGIEKEITSVSTNEQAGEVTGANDFARDYQTAKNATKEQLIKTAEARKLSDFTEISITGSTSLNNITQGNHIHNRCWNISDNKCNGSNKRSKILCRSK